LVRGFDPGAPATDDLVAQLQQALTDYSLLLFRGQEISAAQLVKLGRAFGELEILPEPDKRHPDHPEIFDLTNVRPDGDIVEFDEPQAVFLRGTERWHTDSSFREIPCLCTMLYAAEVPPTGGETLFADMYGAHAALPEHTRASIEGLRLVHSYEFSRANNPGEMERMSPEERAKYPPVIHPLVRQHSDSRRSLYMGAHASHVDGLPIDEGRALLESVVEFATQNRFVYEHVWEANDLVVWDNRSTLHRLQPYDIANERRVMRRITVAGTEPPV
ncbi:MAG: TauD/TfdA family dioxygenase, partial [Actinomycetota bacterium]|nr:TauD/TfdA family dioxygenase [Actinomycetota bacterium]